MGTYCFGIDVGGTTVKCGLFRTDGTLVEKWEIPTRKENNGDQILPDVAAAVNAKIEEKGISKDDVEGSEAASSFFAIRTIPVAEANCSRQPLFPQLQDSVS